MVDREVTTPPLKWHGGKNYLAAWIQSLAPEGRYIHRVHPYGGGLGEFWSWPHAGISEVVNDIDGRLTNLWRVLASESQFRHFARAAQATPFCQSVWEKSGVPTLVLRDDPEGDWRAALVFFIHVRQSRQGLMESWATLSRRRTRRGMSEQASAWLSAVEGLPEVHARLKRVVITNMDAVKLIRQQDGPKTLFYLDPPYLGPERSTLGTYAHEMTWPDHGILLEALAGIEGFFMLSGYHNTLYDGWAEHNGFMCHERRIDNKASSVAKKPVKTECLWTNYQLFR